MLTSYAQSLVVNYDYSDILPPSQIPTVANYPSLNSVLPALMTFLDAAQPILEAVAQSSSFPMSLSCGSMANLVAQGQTVAQQLDQLSPTPYLLNAEVWDTVNALQTFLLYPELFSA